MGLESASVRLCICPSTLSNMNISETSWPIVIKFHLEHHWGGGFGQDWIRTLVSMATDSSLRVRMTTPSLSFLIGYSLFLQETKTIIKSRGVRNSAGSDQGLMS